VKRLLVVYHSASGGTRQLLEAVLEGARDPEAGEVDILVRPALSATAEDVLTADGLLLGTPENFGYMSGGLKDFFDRIYNPCLEHTAGLPFGLFIRAGNDGRGAEQAVQRIVTGLRWRQVAPVLIARGPLEDTALHEARELGLSLAAGLAGGIF
jgi:multimeric flavodoxin WrbA